MKYFKLKDSITRHLNVTKVRPRNAAISKEPSNIKGLQQVSNSNINQGLQFNAKGHSRNDGATKKNTEITNQLNMLISYDKLKSKVNETQKSKLTAQHTVKLPGSGNFQKINPKLIAEKYKKQYDIKIESMQRFQPLKASTKISLQKRSTSPVMPKREVFFVRKARPYQ